MTQSHEAPTPVSRWEILGAWLHVWTPPRGAQIPPIPWRRIGIWTAIGAAVLAIAAVIAVPRISAGKQASARRDATTLARERAAERRQIERAQTPHHGRAAKPAHGVTVGDRVALLDGAEAAVLADAKARVKAGTLQSPVSDLTCVRAPQGTSLPPAPERDPAVAAAGYDCTAITGKIAAGEHNVAGALGYPFRLKVDFRRFSYVWCKQTPLPGEQVIPDPRTVVPLPKICRV